MSLLTQASLVLTPNAYKANKLYSIIPSSGSGDMSFTRATTATISSTRTNSSGVIENVANGVPRLNYSGSVPSILLEPQRTNTVLNSATVVTQTITTTAVANTLSFYGTGTITLSGTFAGTLVGTGASNRVTLTFTPTAGSLVLTVSGSCTNGQLEVGSYATSYIPTTSTVTRNQDLASVSSISSLIGQTEGVMFIESAALANDLTDRIISISDGTTLNRIILYYSTSSNNIAVAMVSGGTVVIPGISYNVSDETQFAKIAVRYSNTLGVSLWVNGLNRNNSVVTTLPISMTKFSFDRATSGNNPFFAKVKSAQLYKTYLTDAEMASLTTL